MCCALQEADRRVNAGRRSAPLRLLAARIYPTPPPRSPSNTAFTTPRERIYSSWLPRTVLRAAMGKKRLPIPGTSGPSHPLQSTIQPILGVLEQFWPKTLLSRRIPQLAEQSSSKPLTTPRWSTPATPRQAASSEISRPPSTKIQRYKVKTRESGQESLKEFSGKDIIFPPSF